MENKNSNTSIPYPNADDALSSSIIFGGSEPRSDSSAGGLQAFVQSPPKDATFSVWLKRGSIILGALSLVVVLILIVWRPSKEPIDRSVSPAAEYDTITIPLSEIDITTSLSEARTVSINGALDLSGGLTLVPSLQPATAKPGQLYFDQGTNKLAYYNGTQFISLGGQSAVVQSVGGSSGQLTTGNGIGVVDNQLFNTGVLSLGGQTGVMTLGDGLVMGGNILQNNGVLSIAPGSGNVSVANDGSGNVTIDIVGAGTGTVTSAGGTVGRIPVYTGSQNIEDSVISQSGLTATVNGSLSVTTTLSLSNALTVANGGTGATTLAANGVIVGAGTGSLTSVTAGGTGLCLMSTVGAPAFSACPGSGGVTTLNGLAGALTIANASAGGSTITINDATTAAKGIASYNSTNFSVTAGAVNTVQNINSGATPTFAGVNTNTITPSAALSIGAVGQTTLLQGSVTTITSSGGGNNIVLDSANIIDLQDNTDVAGSLNVGTANAFQINTSGAITAATGITSSGTITFSALNCTANANGGALTANGSGQVVCSDDDGGSGSAITGSGTNGTIPIFTGAQTIGDSIITHAAGTITIGGSLALSNALTVPNGGTGLASFTSNGLLYGNAGGNLQVTAAGTSGQVLVANGSGVPTFVTFSGDLAVSNAGVTTIQINSVALGTDTTGNYVADVTAGTGISVGGTPGEGWSPSVAVLYGNTAGTAVQGNTSLTVSAGTNLTGGGSITLGTGGSVTLNVANSPSFSGTLTVQGATATIGTTTQSGSLVLNDGSNETITINTAILGGSRTYTIPDAGGSADFCLTSGNCAGTGGGITGSGTTDRIAKFTNSGTIGNSSVSDNGNLVTILGTTNLLIQGGTNTIGSTSQQGSLVLHDGNGETVTLRVGSGLGADSIIAIPSTVGASDTVCLLTLANCTGSGSGNTLQAAYDAGNTIATTNSRNIAFTLSDDTVDSNFIVDLLCDTSCGSNGRFAVQDDGADVFSIAPSGGLATFLTDADFTLSGSENIAVTSTLSGTTALNVLDVQLTNGTTSGNQNGLTVQNADSTGITEALLQLGNLDSTAGSVLAGLSVTASAANGITNALDVSDDEIVTALLFGTNDISGTNFSVTGSTGAVSAGSLTLGTALSVANGGTGAVSFNNQGVLYGNSTGAIQATSAGTSGQVLVANGSGTPVFVSFSGDITVTSAGVTAIQSNAVTLTTDTAGDYVANLGALTGLSTTGNTGEGSTPTLSVTYGSGANNSVQGNTTLTCPSGTGNLTGGGTSITLGTGGSCASLNTVNNPVFSTSVTSPLLILQDGTGDTTTIQAGDSTGNLTFILPTNTGTANQCLKQSGTGNQLVWQDCDGGSGGSSATLQSAYANGNTITTTSARNVAFTLDDSATDSNFTVTTATGATGFTSILRADGAGAADPTQLLLIANNDTNRAQPIGLSLQAAGGGLTTAIDATDTDIGTALSVAANDITGTNFGLDGNGGTLTLQGTGTVTYTTPGSNSVPAKLTIAGYAAGTNGQAIAVGLTSGADVSARGISVFDARSGSHQPSIAVFSPDEASSVGFTWNGSNTTAVLQTKDDNANGGTSESLEVRTGAGTGTNTSSGSIGIDVGAKTGSGITGVITIGGTNASAINLGYTSGSSNVITTVRGFTVLRPRADTPGTLVLDIQDAGGTTFVSVDSNTANLVLGKASTATGRLQFQGSGTAGRIILSGPASPDTNNYTLTIPAITGNANVCTDNAVCSGYAPSSGSTNYIQNQIAGQQSSSNFWISATGRADTSLLTPTLDTATGVDLNIGTTNASSIALKENTTIDTGKSLTLLGGSSNILATSAATGTTGTTEAVARTNVTTVTLIAAGGFADNDIIFLNNAGQDYYTRIVSGGGTTTLTVSPAVSYDVSTAVTKYTAQNIGATTTDYTTQANRFFQGYFLGGVVAGAGSTTLSDGRLLSSGALNLNATTGFNLTGAAASVIDAGSNTITVTSSNFSVDSGGAISSSGPASFTSNVTIQGTTGLTFNTGAGGDITFANLEKIDNDTNGTINLQANSGALTTLLTGTSATVTNSAGDLTLDSFSGRLVVATGDFLKTSVSGVSGAAAGDIWYDTSDGKYKINEASGGTKILCNKVDLNCGAGATTPLQTAYQDGNTITTSTAEGDLSVILADDSTDPNFLVDLQCDTSCSTNGRFAVQDDGADIFTVSPAAGGIVMGSNTLNTPLTLNSGTGTISIGTGAQARIINIGNGAADQDVTIGSTSSGSSLTLNAGSGNAVLNATSGTVTLQTTTSGDINIKPAAVDGGDILLGTSDTVGQQLVLDTKTDAGDPGTGINGGMYYNSNSKTFRCYENGAWYDCLSRHKIVLGSDVVDNTGACTSADITGLSFSVAANTTYRFHALIEFTSASTATGSEWSVTVPSNNYFSSVERHPLTSTTEQVFYGTVSDDGACSTVSAFTTGNIAIVEGMVSTTASGTVQMRIASEANGSAITAKAGSTLEWW